VAAYNAQQNAAANQSAIAIAAQRAQNDALMSRLAYAKDIFSMAGGLV